MQLLFDCAEVAVSLIDVRMESFVISHIYIHAFKFLYTREIFYLSLNLFKALINVNVCESLIGYHRRVSYRLSQKSLLSVVTFRLE